MRVILMVISVAFILQALVYAQNQNYVEIEKIEEKIVPKKPQRMMGDLHGTMFDYLVTDEEAERYERYQEKLKHKRDKERLEATKKRIKMQSRSTQ